MCGFAIDSGSIWLPTTSPAPRTLRFFARQSARTFITDCFVMRRTICNRISVSGSCRFRLPRQEDADFAFAHFHFKDFQVHFCRAVGDFSGTHVETGVVPRASDVESVEAAFGKRTEAVGAEFLKGEKLF